MTGSIEVLNIIANESKFKSSDSFQKWVSLIPRFQKAATVEPKIAALRKEINRLCEAFGDPVSAYEKVRIENHLSNEEFYIALKLNGNIWANEYYKKSENAEIINSMLKKLEKV